MRIDSTNADEHQGGFVGIGGFYVRPMEFKQGQRHDGHEHYIDHVGNLVRGSVNVHWKDMATGEAGVIEMRVPSKIHMPAGRWHRLEFLEDTLWECWFAQAEADRIYGTDAQVKWHLEKG